MVELKPCDRNLKTCKQVGMFGGTPAGGMYFGAAHGSDTHVPCSTMLGRHRHLAGHSGCNAVLRMDMLAPALRPLVAHVLLGAC